MNRKPLALWGTLILVSLSLTTVATAVPPARYQALGGAAISFTDDAFAGRFNPAGLGRIGKASFVLSLSPIFGSLHAPIISNANSLRPKVADRQLDSEPIFGPGFMIAGAYRATKWLSFGLAIYPVSAGGADYRYVENPDSTTDPKIMDFTKKLHAEVAPSITFTIPKSLIGGQYLSIGVAYRLSYGSLTRQKGDPEDPQTIDINATGLNFGGFTVGLQYAPVPEFQIGLVYRHGIRVALEGTKGSINPGVLVEGDVTAEIVAPGMFGVGVRGNFGAVSLMLDFEYELNSLSDASVLTITDPSQTWLKPSTVELEGRTYEFGEGVLPLFATYFWRDSINIKSGLEWRISPKLAGMLGYTWVQRSGNPKYATPFGAPPADSHVASLGVRYDHGSWVMNFAYNFRYAKATLSEEDVTGQGVCNICTEAGDYILMLHGIHLDFSYRF